MSAQGYHMRIDSGKVALQLKLKLAIAILKQGVFVQHA